VWMFVRWVGEERSRWSDRERRSVWISGERRLGIICRPRDVLELMVMIHVSCVESFYSMRGTKKRLCN
jgi:hypothetical protein